MDRRGSRGRRINYRHREKAGGLVGWALPTERHASVGSAHPTTSSLSSLLGPLWLSCVTEAVGSAPQAEGGVGDVEHFLAVRQRVPAVAQAVRRVTGLHRLEVPVPEAD